MGERGKQHLTGNQQRVYDYIAQHTRLHGRPPTVREIGARFHLSSTGSVRTYLEALERKGWISREGSIARNITIVAPQPGRGQAPRSPARARPTLQIPILGRVAAGPPILAVEDVQEILDMDERIVPSRGQLFALRVQGDSMVNAGIRDGDYVFVRRQEAADKGDIIVAVLDGEATVKFYHPANGKVRLVPANDSLQPTLVDPRRSDFTVVGKVTGMMRRF